MALRKRQPAVDKDRVELGRVLKSHGLRGEIKFSPWSCDPWILEELRLVNLDLSKLDTPNFVLEVEYVRGTEKEPIVKFKTVEDRNASERLHGAIIWVSQSVLPELEEGVYYESDLLDCRVITPSGEELGRITQIMETGACDVLVIHNSSNQEILLPANRQVIQEIRLAERTLVVVPLDYAETEDAVTDHED